MHRLRIGGVRPASIDPQIAAVRPTQFLQLLDKRSALRLGFRIALRPAHQHSDLPHPVRLLRPRRKRPSRRAAEKRDELAPPDHSITSSARAMRVGGTSRPSALAVLRLIAKINFVGWSTGKS